MFFDTLAGIVERHLPQFADVLNRASIFRLEREPAQSAGEAVDTWHPDERTMENFRLPFNTVAIEYAPDRNTASDNCVVFSQFGPAANRQLRFLVGFGRDRGTTIGAGVLTALPGAEMLGASYDHLLTIHQIRVWDGSKKGGVESRKCRLEWIGRDYDRLSRMERGNALEKLMARHAREDWTREELDREIATAKARIADSEGEIDKMITNMAAGRCAVGVLAVLMINEPAKFVVEERPVRESKIAPTAIPRSAAREHFIVLNPRQIRQRFIWPDGKEPDEHDEGICKVTPHERRGHFRCYHSERYRNARGQVVWIKPMWVGPSEAIKGGNRYKVRLDL